MTVNSGTPVGPFPPGIDTDDQRSEYDKLRRRVLWKLPYGLYALGSRAGDEHNLMAINWVTQLSFEPKLLGVGVERDALSCRLVEEGGSFTLNLIDRDDRAIVRKLTKPVAHDAAAGTLNGFAFHPARSGAPILDQCVAWVDCEVRQAVPTGSHILFIGEVVDAGFARDEGRDVLRMEDTRMSYGG